MSSFQENNVYKCNMHSPMKRTFMPLNRSHNRGRRLYVLGSAPTHNMGQCFYFRTNCAILTWNTRADSRTCLGLNSILSYVTQSGNAYNENTQVLSCGPKASNILGISDAISPRYIPKNPRRMCARVQHMMAQFVLKIGKLSHILWTAPTIEMAQTHGLPPSW